MLRGILLVRVIFQHHYSSETPVAFVVIVPRMQASCSAFYAEAVVQCWLICWISERSVDPVKQFVLQSYIFCDLVVFTSSIEARPSPLIHVCEVSLNAMLRHTDLPGDVNKPEDACRLSPCSSWLSFPLGLLSCSITVM